MNVKISRNNDPFRKYWWVVLVGFGLVGAWVCLPLMESGTGSVSGTAGAKSAEQSLDSVNNPSGAPGSAVDLSMDGTGAYRKKGSEGPIASSLYQAPAEVSSSSGSASTGFKFAVPFDYSMHNYLLRYYLAEHGIDPDADVQIREIGRAHV